MAENAAADIMVPLLLSLRVAGLATFFSFVFGVGLAWVMSRRRGPVRSVIDALCTLPMVLPPTVLGYYLILFAAVQILRIAVVRLIGAIFSADNSVMRLLNRVFGMLFMVAAVFLLTLLVLAVFRIFDDTSFVQGIVEDISGSFLGTLYRHNPVKFVS